MATAKSDENKRKRSKSLDLTRHQRFEATRGPRNFRPEWKMLEHEEFKKKVSEPHSCLVLVKDHQTRIRMSPRYITELMRGIRASLDKQIGQCVEELDGIVVSYDRVRKLGVGALCNPKDNLLHFDVVYDVVMFKPDIGQSLQCVISKFHPDHIGVIIHGWFNGSMPLFDIPEGKNISVGSNILMRVKAIHFKHNIWHIKGDITKKRLVQHIKGIDFKYKGKLGKDTGRKAGGPFAIPEPFRWDESFRVFYELLDEEHKGLFNGIFNCSKYRGDAGKLNSLIEKVDDHFKSEEALFDERDYEGSANHKKAHDDFLRKLRKLSVPLDDGAINYAKNWLVQHIKSIDFKYRNQLG